MNSRAVRSTYSSWWWTIDRVALLLMLALITIGLMLAFAASPAATGGPLTAGDFRYTAKQILFAVIAIASWRRLDPVAAAAQAVRRHHLRVRPDRFRPRPRHRQ
ncbi:MAG: hypothetical protein WDM81_17170 [Rhizomicrobium sp.]